MTFRVLLHMCPQSPALALFLALGAGGAQVSAQQGASASLDQLLEEREPSAPSLEQPARAAWDAMVEAFAQNDGEKGRELAEGLLERKALYEPRQISAAQMLLQITDPAGQEPESAQSAALRTKASEALAEIQRAETELLRIKTEVSQLPDRYTQGSQVHLRMLQLQKEDIFYQNLRSERREEYEELRRQNEALESARTQDAESSLLTLATSLAEDGEIEAALALCNSYVHRRPEAAAVAARGSELLGMRQAADRGRQLAKAAERAVRELMAEGRLQAASDELRQSRRLVEARVENRTELATFGRLIGPLESQLAEALRAARAAAADALKLAQSAPDLAERQLDEVLRTASDLPEIEDVRSAIARERMESSAARHASRLDAVREVGRSDPNAARDLLRQLEESLGAEDAAILAAELKGVWRGIWRAELAAARSDMDEAHSYLERIGSRFQHTLQSGDREELRSRLSSVSARENFTRARSLVRGALGRVRAIPADELDAALRGQAEGLRAALEQSEEELARATSILEEDEDSLPRWIMLGAAAAACILAALVIAILALLARRRRRRTVSPA